jgi:hypothetical protein
MRARPEKREPGKAAVGVMPTETSSIGRFAVGQERDLEFQERAVFAEAKTNPLHGADVPRFPFRRVDGLLRFVAGRQFHFLASGLHRLRIDLVNFLLMHIDEQIPFPEVQEQQALFLRVVEVPGFWRLVIEFHDGEFHGFPSLIAFGLRNNRRQHQQEANRNAYQGSNGRLS